MQENRSFDQFFGTFPGVRGFDDQHNRTAFAQPGYQGPGSQNGHLLPFHMDARQPVGQCLTDPTPAWLAQHLSWNQGRNDRFYEVHSQPRWGGAAGVNVMGYFDEPDIPYFWALARTFTVCDRFFSSVLAPSEPNRLYAVSATIDPAGTHGGPSITTYFSPPIHSRFQGLYGRFSWTTMPEQLRTRGITWKSYTAAEGQFDSPFPAFVQFQTSPVLNKLGILPTYPSDFEADLDRDELPAVSWIQVSFAESGHSPFPLAKAEYAVDQVLRAIWRRPQIWRKTVVIIPHDENGGFFDHVAPPTPPRGTAGEFITVNPLPALAGGIRGPIGLGFRVPCTIVSPWTRGGYVCSDTFDHTSTLRLIERRFGVEVPNLSEWRRSVTGDMTSAFNFASPPDYSIPSLPPTSASSPVVSTAQCANPQRPPRLAPVPPYPVPRTIPMPRQQSGQPRRPSGPC